MTNQPPSMKWPGKSGTEYEYFIYDISMTWDPNQAGNYIFTKRRPKEGGGHIHDPIYIGETDDFKARFANHHQAGCINSNGATHVVLHLNTDAKARLAEETDLRNQWTTPCNEQ